VSRSVLALPDSQTFSAGTAFCPSVWGHTSLGAYHALPIFSQLTLRQMRQGRAFQLLPRALWTQKEKRPHGSLSPRRCQTGERSVNDPGGRRARARTETDAGKLPSVRGLGLTRALSPKGSSEEPSVWCVLEFVQSVLDQSIPEPKHQRKYRIVVLSGKRFRLLTSKIGWDQPFTSPSYRGRPTSLPDASHASNRRLRWGSLRG
jgi:hypothetical protein